MPGCSQVYPTVNREKLGSTIESKNYDLSQFLANTTEQGQNKLGNTVLLKQGSWGLSCFTEVRWRAGPGNYIMLFKCLSSYSLISPLTSSLHGGEKE